MKSKIKTLDEVRPLYKGETLARSVVQVVLDLHLQVLDVLEELEGAEATGRVGRVLVEQRCSRGVQGGLGGAAARGVARRRALPARRVRLRAVALAPGRPSGLEHRPSAVLFVAFLPRLERSVTRRV